MSAQLVYKFIDAKITLFKCDILDKHLKLLTQSSLLIFYLKLIFWNNMNSKCSKYYNSLFQPIKILNCMFDILKLRMHMFLSYLLTCNY